MAHKPLRGQIFPLFWSFRLVFTLSGFPMGQTNPFGRHAGLVLSVFALSSLFLGGGFCLIGPRRRVFALNASGLFDQLFNHSRHGKRKAGFVAHS